MTDGQEALAGPSAARRATLLAYGCTYSMIIGVSSVMPLLPFLAKTFEVSLTHAGLVISAFTLPGIFFTPVGGILADRYSRKAVLVPSLILFCLAGAGCAAAPDFPSLIALRFLQGVGASSFGTLNNTILADTFRGNDLSRAIGWNITLLSVCTALFPLVGGLLGDINPRLTFLLPLTSLPILLPALRSSLARPERGAAASHPVAGMFRAVAEPKIRLLLLLTLLTFTMLYGPIITCLPVLGAHEFGQSAGYIGLLVTASSAGAALVAPFTGRLSQRFPLRSLILFAQIFYVAALLLIPEMPTFWLLLVPIFFYGLGQGFNIPNLQADLAKSAPKELRASVMAANGMLLRLGQTITPLLFTALIDARGVQSGFHTGVALSCSLFVLAWFFLPVKKEPEAVSKKTQEAIKTK